MPRQVVRLPGHDKGRSLGWLAVWWLETFTVYADGSVAGQPRRVVDEHAGFILDCYALDEDGGRLYDSAFFSRPKGADKSGVASALALFEAFGPCRFDGWAEGGETYEFLGQTYVYSAGDAMGKPMKTPVVRVIATEEDQIKDGIYKTILYNLTEELAPLSALAAYGVEAGKTRTTIPGGGMILPSTASAASKDGGKETFTVFDETHLYNSNALREMYDTVVRNTRKRKKEGTWYIETTTMYAPGEESKAEETYKYAQKVLEGKTHRARLLFDHRWGDLRDSDGKPMELGAVATEAEQLELEAAVRRALIDSYGDALLWMDLEALIDGVFDARSSIVSTMRYFLNSIYDVKEQWLPSAAVRKASELGEERGPLRHGEQVTLGFDGSKNKDATVLVACRVSDGALFVLHVQEQPDSKAADEWAVDRVAVDAAVRHAFETYEVVGFFADPPFYQDYLDAWLVEFGDRLRVSSGAHAIEWWTKNQEPMHKALERFRDALVDGDIAICEVAGGAPAATLVRHAVNARVRERGDRYIIGKESAGSPKKIDAVMGAVLAYECRAKYLWKGDKPEPEKPRVFLRVR